MLARQPSRPSLLSVDTSAAPTDKNAPLSAVHVELDGAKILGLDFPKELSEATAALNESIKGAGGYICGASKIPGEWFTVVFSDAAKAVEYALTLQNAAFSMKYETTEFDAFYKEEDERSSVAVDDAAYGAVWNGLRFKVGIARGVPTNIEMRDANRRYAYVGDVMNESKRCAEAAVGGQILATAGSLDGSMPTSAVVVDLGKQKIPWIDEELFVCSVVPEGLRGRPFTNGLKAAAPEGSSVQRLRGRIADSRDAVDEVDTLKKRIAAQDDEIAALKQRVADLESENSRLKGK